MPILAVFATFGAVMWLAYEDGSHGSPVGEPPLIKADSAPIKLAPDDPGGREVADQGQVRELLADTAPPQPMEQLLPPEEEPLTPVPEQPVAVDTPQVAEPPPAESGNDGRAVPATQAEVVAPPASVQPEAVAESEAVARPESGSAPSIVERAEPGPAAPEAQVAEAAGPLTAERPDAATTTPSEAEAALDALLAEVTRQAEGGGPSPAPATTAPPPAPVTSRPTTPAEREVAATPAPTTTAPRTARPAVSVSQPATTARSGVGRPSSPAVAEVAPGQPVVRTPTATPPADEPLTVVLPRIAEAPDSQTPLEGRYRVQLAAVREEADARRAWDLFAVDLGPVLRDVEPYIERADTSNGIFYRVQVGPFTELADAEALCEDLKQRNASCFVVRR